MKYSLLFKQGAVKNIQKLSQKDRQKISTILESLKSDPFSGKQLAGEYKHFYSVRAWPYRIIYTIVKKELLVLIIDVAHRKDAYNTIPN